MISKIYRCSLSLLTDFYQLTMTYGYWKKNIHNKEACFNVFFRERPFKSGYAVFCGLEYVIDFLKNIKHNTIPGGDFFRRPIYSTAVAYYKLRDLI